MAELVYAYVSEAYPVRVGSSSLPTPTQYRMAYVREASASTREPAKAGTEAQDLLRYFLKSPKGIKSL